MKLLKDFIAAIKHLGDAVFALAKSSEAWRNDFGQRVGEEMGLGDEKFQELMRKIYSTEAQEEEISSVEDENSLPTAEMVEFSPEAGDSDALREDMLDYLRDRGVVVEGKTSAEVELEVSQQLGIAQSALNLMAWSGRD